MSQVLSLRHLRLMVFCCWPSFPLDLRCFAVPVVGVLFLLSGAISFFISSSSLEQFFCLEFFSGPFGLFSALIFWSVDGNVDFFLGLSYRVNLSSWLYILRISLTYDNNSPPYRVDVFFFIYEIYNQDSSISQWNALTWGSSIITQNNCSAWPRLGYSQSRSLISLSKPPTNTHHRNF